MKDKFDGKKVLSLIKEMMQHLPVIEQEINDLKSKQKPSPKEEHQLKELVDNVAKMKETVENVQVLFGDRAYRKAVAFYYNVKEQAEKGDEKAKKVYEQLKPLYKDGLNEQINDN